MPRYKPDERNQLQYVFIDFEAQIEKGSFEWALNDIIENKIDLNEFDAEFNNSNTGASAYNPRVMLKIIFYAYSNGLVYSREIEKACKNQIKFMALTGSAKPDHSASLRSLGPYS